MKTILLSILLLVQFKINAQSCKNCGSCGVSIQMVCPESKGKLYDAICILYCNNHKISMQLFRQIVTEVAPALGCEYDGTLKGNLKILNTCCPHNLQIFISEHTQNLINQQCKTK